jgi:hypothetical protein
MRLAYVVLASLLFLASCARNSGTRATQNPSGSGTKAPVLKSSSVLVGRIDSINLKARYVIVSFPLGALPSSGSLLDVYREGLKVAELKVTPPQQNNLTAADILAGECRLGDEVRTK